MTILLALFYGIAAVKVAQIIRNRQIPEEVQREGPPPEEWQDLPLIHQAKCGLALAVMFPFLYTLHRWAEAGSFAGFFLLIALVLVIRIYLYLITPPPARLIESDKP